MFPGPGAPFVPPHFGLKSASEAWELAAAMRLRRDVFCTEQRIFASDDRDEDDAIAETIVAVGYIVGMTDRVVGTVRIVELAPGRWHGSRLAIGRPYRDVYGLGRALVYRAVATATARGATDFTATVQRANVSFFRRLAWEAVDEVDLHGHPHTCMRADLAAYPPLVDPGRAAFHRVGRAS
ncbi:MAG: hypothetical protein NVS3B17_20540 [Vulcanimicrobiaceae bacterium]